ncbi:MAG: cyclic nucleotide-binding domain-containing protein [Verrucomicrobia bacterium]|nr:cyclic nucleotide-binding domain-containing protein [Verrucomicrobiota bacterium]
MEIQYCGLTDVGRTRPENEDNFLADPELNLYVVCDGMGGHAAGEVASKIAVQTFHNEIWKEQSRIKSYLAGENGVNKIDLLNLMAFAANRASSEVHAESLANSDCTGMGTTLVAILIAGTEAFILNVGDSRAYMLRNGSLEQLTTDHTVYNELVSSGQLPLAQAEELGVANSITRAIGTFEHTNPETLIIDLLHNDRFLICSDGLSHYFEEDIKILGELAGIHDLNHATQTMINVANEAGGGDNITAINIAVSESGQRDEQRARMLNLKHKLLSKMPLFNQLDERELLHVLQVTEVVSFKDRETIIKEGEEGDSLFILLEGEALVKQGKNELAQLVPGDHFGEMALVRGEPRSADVVSKGDSELMVIRRAEFFEILRQEHQLAVKLLWQFLGVLSNRFANTNQELGKAREMLGADDATWKQIFNPEGVSQSYEIDKKKDS